MTPEQKAAAEFYAKATPREARKHALRKWRVKYVTDGAGNIIIDDPALTHPAAAFVDEE